MKTKKLGNLIANKFLIGKLIGKGSFGDTYSGENIITRQKVALKFESINTPFLTNDANPEESKPLCLEKRIFLDEMKKKEQKQCKNPVLIYECRILRCLNGAVGFPAIYWYGICEQFNANVIVMDLLDQSLSSLQKDDNNNIQTFSLKTVLMIAFQMITRLEYLHRKGYIHGDVKPENMLLGRGYNSNVIYLIDFGLSQRFVDENGKHIEYGEDTRIFGTPRYLSINSHLGIRLSRRDDLESLGYVLIYFLKGKLPWQGIAETIKKKPSTQFEFNDIHIQTKKKITTKTKRKKQVSSENTEVFIDENLTTEKQQSDTDPKLDLYTRIAEIKMRTPLEELCDGIPNEFLTYLQQVRSLRFEDEPDYVFYRKLFRSLFIRSGFIYDMEFDWSI